MSTKTYGAPSTCGTCGKSYTQASSLKNHYLTKTIKLEGKLIPNQCYQAETRLAVHSLSEAETIKKLHGNINNFVVRKASEEINNFRFSNKMLLSLRFMAL